MKTIQEAIIAIDNLIEEHARIYNNDSREIASMTMNELLSYHEKQCVLTGLLKAQTAINE